MDEQPMAGSEPVKQQQQVEELQVPSSGAFLLAGQLQTNKQLQRKQFDSSSYVACSEGLISLFSGFPSVSSKTDSTTLTRFPVQYLPAKNDLVIGVVKVRTAQTFIVDIGAPMDGILGGLQFDGATKRNKPNLKSGALIFCRVVEYSKHTGAKVSCINKGFSTKKSNEMGELKDGYMFWIPQYYHQFIQSTLLEKLGKCIKFEVAFGKNGRIWINSARIQNIMLLSNIFRVSVDSSAQDKVNAMIALLK